MALNPARFIYLLITIIIMPLFWVIPGVFGVFGSIFLLEFLIFSCTKKWWLDANEVRSKENRTPCEMLLCHWCEMSEH